MKIKGFIINEIEISNAIILCYKDYELAKDVYDKFVEQRYKYGFHTRTYLRFVWSPGEEYECKVVVEFINRNKDTYIDPPKFVFQGTDLDEFQEMTFMSSVDIKEGKIIYSGDVPRIGKGEWIR